MDHEAIVIGGSFAGISAALQLARARRRVLVIDEGKRRNRFAHESHGFFAQDGRAPGDMVAEARRQLGAYPTVSFHDGIATHAARTDEGFDVTLGIGNVVSGHRLILATGVKDHLPPVPGLAERWGRSVFHCPYCHGYELGGGPVAVLAVGPASLHHALMLPDWAPTTFLLDGKFEPDVTERDALEKRGVEVVDAPVEEIADAAGGRLLVNLRGTTNREFAGLFVAPRTEIAAPLAEELGCEIEAGPLGEFIRTDAMKSTSVPGVMACGDAARMAGNVALAVGDGTMAGAMAHRTLMFGLG
jgi:thioredoxin reductase